MQRDDERKTVTVLVTGANSGLGYATCCRLIDEFHFTRPEGQKLRLLFSTRDVKKRDDTLKRLNNHLLRSLHSGQERTSDAAQLLNGRIQLEGVLVDLLKLPTVKSLARTLLDRREKLDAVVWNAGIAGWSGLNWPKAVWYVLTDLVHATTYPTYPICQVGLLAKLQLDGALPEPALGHVFTANVFGHYMLTHWLAPLMDRDSRIIWVSSISAVPETFQPNDLQTLRGNMSYEGSKRLTDYLVLTSELPSTKSYVDRFLPPSTTTSPPPRMFVTHPGVVGTSIAGLHWFIDLFMFLAFYVARLLGSPWHGVHPYKGAVSAAFAALAPAEQFTEREQHEGKGKWGSATTVMGEERVARTEVEGWGYCGKVGVVPQGSVTGATGRFRGHKRTTPEMREEFEVVGRRIWREMEELREDWEARLAKVEGKLK